MSRGPRLYSQTSNFKRGLLTVKRLIANPCDRPLIVYAELLAEPTGRAAIRFLSFGMLDLIRSYFRPKENRTTRKIRGGRRGRRGGGGIPEPSDLIAKRVPGYERFRNRRVSQGVRNLWLIDGVGQRVALQFLIFDIVKEWTVSSGSIILEADQTDCNTTGAGFWDGPIGGSPGAAWIGFGAMNPVFQRNLTAAGGSVSVPPGRIGTMIATASQRGSQFETGGEWEVAIQKDTEPESQWSKSGASPLTANSIAEAVAERTAVGPCILTAYHQRRSSNVGTGGDHLVYFVYT